MAGHFPKRSKPYGVLGLPVPQPLFERICNLVFIIANLYVLPQLQEYHYYDSSRIVHPLPSNRENCPCIVRVKTFVETQALKIFQLLGSS